MPLPCETHVKTQSLSVDLDTMDFVSVRIDCTKTTPFATATAAVLSVMERRASGTKPKAAVKNGLFVSENSSNTKDVADVPF